MGDELRRRTEQLLTDYLEYCARRPGTAGWQPSTPEATLMLHLASRVQHRHQLLLSCYREYQGSLLQLVENVAHLLVRDRGSPSWGRVVVLVTFVGILLERPPAIHSWKLQKWEEDVGPECRRLVAFLCDWLTVEHRAWLEAQGGWILFPLFLTGVELMTEVTQTVEQIQPNYQKPTVGSAVRPVVISVAPFMENRQKPKFSH